MQTRKRTNTTTTIAKQTVNVTYKRKETSTQRKRRLKKQKDKREAKKALKILEEQIRLDAKRFQNDVDPLGLLEIKGQEFQEHLPVKPEEEPKLDPTVVKVEHVKIKLERVESPENVYEEENEGFAHGISQAKNTQLGFCNEMVKIKCEYDQEISDQECNYNEVFLPEVKLEAQIEDTD